MGFMGFNIEGVCNVMQVYACTCLLFLHVFIIFCGCLLLRVFLHMFIIMLPRITRAHCANCLKGRAY